MKKSIYQSYDDLPLFLNAEQIPKDARGRFLLHNGTVFQGYLFDEDSL